MADAIPRNGGASPGLNDPMKVVLSLAALSLLWTGPLVAQKARRGPDRAPEQGAAIPKVEAKTPDGKKTVKLSEPKRFTVLVFGSHT